MIYVFAFLISFAAQYIAGRVFGFDYSYRLIFGIFVTWAFLMFFRYVEK